MKKYISQLIKYLPVFFLFATFTANAQLDSGVNYNKTGQIECLQKGTFKNFTCEFGLLKVGNGVYQLHIVSPTERIRKFNFSADSFYFPEESEAQLDTKKDGDVYVVTLNNKEEYRVPASLFTN